MMATHAQHGLSSDAAAESDVKRLESQLTQIAAISELVERMGTANSLAEACRLLATQLQQYISADCIFVGQCAPRSPKCRLLAISGMTVFHPRDDRALAAQAVLQETIARGELTRWPSRQGAAGLLAHRQFAATQLAQGIVAAPLRDQRGQLRGAWMVVGPIKAIHNDQTLRLLRAAETPVATALHLAACCERGRLHQALSAVKHFFLEKRGQACSITALCLATVLCIPTMYRPQNDCTVEPLTRRFVAAPFDGPLEEALVRPGDEIAEGDLLARMDGREVRWELAGIRADLHRATKQRAGHVAAHDSGQAELARHDVDRLQMRTQLLERRDQELEIRSPLAGVVVSGDLKDAEGMPLETGRTLFEVAPLGRMKVEIAIREDDFAYVRSGMKATIQLNAFPLQSFEATIARIHPRAELRESENVFIAEIELDNPSGILRPGMRGTATIAADRYPLGWNLLRRPITAALTWLGW
jgi:hypothetical protein